MQGGQHEVTCERCLDGGPGRLDVADFADHHHIRVVAQDGSQPGLEGHAHLVIDGDLVDALQVVFDRVLDRQHLESRTHDFVERRVEGRGFTGTGGPGDQDNSVGSFDEASESAVGFLIHAQLGQGEEHVGLVEQTHDHAFAEQHGDDRDADVDLPPADVELDAPVLRDAALGDVQVRQDLDARDDRRLKPVHLRRHRGLVEDTVDAVANGHLVLVGLDMDIASPLVHRLDDDLVDQADDRRLLGHLQQILAAAGDGTTGFVVVGSEFVERVATQTVVGLDELLDVILDGQDGVDLQPGGHPHVVHRVEVERIARGHPKGVAFACDGHDALAEHHLRGE